MTGVKHILDPIFKVIIHSRSTVSYVLSSQSPIFKFLSILSYIVFRFVRSRLSNEILCLL